MQRRSFVITCSAVSVATIAGCLDGDDDEQADQTEDDGEPSPEEEEGGGIEGVLYAVDFEAAGFEEERSSIQDDTGSRTVINDENDYFLSIFVSRHEDPNEAANALHGGLDADITEEIDIGDEAIKAYVPIEGEPDEGEASFRRGKTVVEVVHLGLTATGNTDGDEDVAAEWAREIHDSVDEWP